MSLGAVMGLRQTQSGDTPSVRDWPLSQQLSTTVKTNGQPDRQTVVFLLLLNFLLLLGEVNFPFIMAAIIAQLTRAKRERANKKTYEPNKVEYLMPT